MSPSLQPHKMYETIGTHAWSNGVMVNTLDFGSSGPNSNLSGTFILGIGRGPLICKKEGLSRDLNPGPPAPKAGIIPLDH